MAYTYMAYTYISPDLIFLNFYSEKIKENLEWIIDYQGRNERKIKKKGCSVINPNEIWFYVMLFLIHYYAQDYYFNLVVFFYFIAYSI